MLSAGLAYSEVAEKVGINQRTLRDWRRKPNFVAELEASIQRQRTAVEAQRIALVVRAERSIEETLNTEHPIARVRAASAILKLLAKERIMPADRPQNRNLKRGLERPQDFEKLLEEQLATNAARGASKGALGSAAKANDRWLLEWPVEMRELARNLPER